MHHPSLARFHSRRRFLAQAGIGAAGLTAAGFFPRGVFAEELERAQTAAVTEGPFYPRKMPLDTDNDLLIVNDAITPAVGEITHLGGKLLDAKGSPIKNALVEIWQTDGVGIYLQERAKREKFDANFQGFGRFLTGSSGEYYFRTIKPVPYFARPAPHIHFKIKLKNHEVLTTQLFVKGDAGNDKDGIYRHIAEGKVRDSVTREFMPVKNSRIGEFACNFDIVLGVTPEG